MKHLWILPPFRTCVCLSKSLCFISTIGKETPFPLKLCRTARVEVQNILVKLPKDLPLLKLFGCVLSRLFT